MDMRGLRLKAGLSQEKLAAALGVSQGSVSHWEVGDNRPAFDMIPKLATVLGTTADEVISAISEVPARC